MDWFPKSEVKFERGSIYESERVNGSIAFGFGYIYNRFGFEIRYKGGKNILPDFYEEHAKIRGFSGIMTLRLY